MNKRQTFTVGIIENIFLSKISSTKFLWWIASFISFQSAAIFLFLFWLKLRKYPESRVRKILKTPHLTFSFENNNFRFPQELLPPYFPGQVSIYQIKKVEKRIGYLVFLHNMEK